MVDNPFAILGGATGSVMGSLWLYVNRTNGGEPFDLRKFLIEAIPSLAIGITVGVASQNFALGFVAGLVAKLGQKPLQQAASGN